MGYQALLFCPDEKLAHIVAQVFSELDFTVEPVQEPFSAVKKLMAQRYDALVVDCESESNASLMFKSARNSSSNQGTLAIAMVEGQAGVAKAYRIGANLVLTKPINVEQAKGTLRVARGLLRKGSDAASNSASVSTPPPAMAGAPTQVALEHAECEPVSPLTAAASEGMAEAAVAAVPGPEASAKSAAVAEAPAPAAVQAPKELVQPAAAAAATVAALNVSTAGTAGQAAAAAPAKAAVKPKEIAPAQKGQAPEFESMDQVHQAAWRDSASATPAPEFAALERPESRGTGSKKILVGAVVLLAAAALGYFAWTTLGQHKSASPAPASAPQSSVSPPVTPMSAPARVAAAPSSDHDAATATLMPTSKVIATAKPEKPGDSLILHLESNPAQPAKAPNTAAIVVKPGKRARVSAEEAPAPEPSELAAASANENALSTVIATTAATPPQPTLATIKISQGVSQGLLIKKVNPIYPPNARSMHLEGAVLLEATIDREGRVVNPVVVKGDKVLARAALDAVRQWRYKPYYLDHQPVEIQTQIMINFKLPN